MSNETLTVTLPSDREISVARVFDAPRHLVFDAWTQPDLIKRWLAPSGWTLIVADIDARVGGTYRFVMRNRKGTEMGWGGVFREVVRPSRFVWTEQFDEPWYPGESVITTDLVEQDGKTTITTTMLYESREARDIAGRSGMESGMAGAYDRLEELLASRHLTSHADRD